MDYKIVVLILCSGVFLKITSAAAVESENDIAR
jgi:hypothetical protein